MNNDVIFRELGDRLGVEMSFYHGATVLSDNDNDGREFWFELACDDSLLIMHTEIASAAAVAGSNEIRQWLTLNTRPDIMKGAWLGIEANSKSLRLCNSTILDIATSEKIEEVFKDFSALTEKVDDEAKRLIIN
ncbi:CesT family type III secretion system chaperone [Agarilytica rhodophyticola]|uniref:CesT family type III secretion system chaperone n=1 Tax=Agarilytica rhodophyticola TaxID=1737490 RepID=UPI000CD998F6|nr:CesT family type III secretion system chaperone [Agarilytica rhodophyticola]